MISFIHVILRLLPMNIFPQKQTLTDLSNKLMVSQNERWEDDVRQLLLDFWLCH